MKEECDRPFWDVSAGGDGGAIILVELESALVLFGDVSAAGVEGALVLFGMSVLLGI